jgi:hypothetical protein
MSSIRCVAASIQGLVTVTRGARSLILVVAFALLASGCGGSAPPPPLPMGTWEVHGVTQASSGAQDDWVGRTYNRSWIVYYGCRDRDCGLRLARQAADATEDAALIRHGYDYAATFTFRT